PRGYPRTRRDYWLRGFARWKNLPPVADLPCYGYLLEGRFGPVGAILSISSRRGERIISNLSSWYVEPQYLGHSALLMSLATKLKHVTYINASPAPDTWRNLQAQGFAPYNFGHSMVFAPPGGARSAKKSPRVCPKRNCC